MVPYWAYHILKELSSPAANMQQGMGKLVWSRASGSHGGSVNLKDGVCGEHMRLTNADLKVVWWMTTCMEIYALLGAICRSFDE